MSPKSGRKNNNDPKARTESQGPKQGGQNDPSMFRHARFWRCPSMFMMLIRDTCSKENKSVVCADFGCPGAGLGPGGSVREGCALALIVLLLVESTVRKGCNLHDF